MAIVKNPFDKYTVLFPENMEYNYYMLENLMPTLNSPYDRWYVKIIKEKNPLYSNLGRNSLCACNSGRKYKNCCLGSPNEFTNHHRITLVDNPNIAPIPRKTINTWK